MQLAPEVVTSMQQLAVEQRRLLGPRAPWHVGDIAWGFRQHEGRESEWKIRSWIEDGRVVAWSWLKGDRGRLEHDVHPEHRHLLDEILAEPAASVAFAFDDDEPMLAALARHGFTEPGEARISSRATWHGHPTCCRCRMAFATERSTARTSRNESRFTAKSGRPPASRSRATRGFARRGRTAHRSIASSRRRKAASPRMRCSGRTTRTASASSSPWVSARSSGDAASEPLSARTRCVGGTTRAAARRSSTARPMQHVLVRVARLPAPCHDPRIRTAGAQHPEKRS